MGQIRVLVADDHALFREGLAGIIATQPDFEVVGRAGDGIEATVKAEQLKPDLILMDIEMPGCDGLEATRQIRQKLPGVPIVILTAFEEEEKLYEAIKCGAQGYLLKTMGSRYMLKLLRGAVRGEAAIMPDMACHLLEEFRHLSRQVPLVSDEEPVALTRREQEVLRLAARDYMDREIAEHLSISVYTVKSHVRNALIKLHASSRHEAVRHARHKGLI